MKEKAGAELARIQVRFSDLGRSAIWQAGAAVAGFAFARTGVAWIGAPFGIAAAAGVTRDLSAAASIGAAIGYFFPVTGIGGFRYLAAIVLISAVRWLLSDKLRFMRTSGFAAVLAFASSMLTALCAAGFGRVGATGLLSYAAESFAAAGCAYFIHGATLLHKSDKPLANLTQQELISIVIVTGTALLSLSGLNISGVAPARIAASVLVLSAARFGREQGGAVAGAALGFALSLNSESGVLLAASYALGGLTAGVFSPAGTLPCAISFAASNAVVLVASGYEGAAQPIIEACTAAVLFILTPQSLKRQLSGLFAPPPEMPRLDGLKKAVAMRLRFASDALADVSATVDDVAVRLGKIKAPSFEDVLTETENSVCKSCALRVQCWETDRAATVSTLVDITKDIHKDGTLPPLYKYAMNVPCGQFDRLAAALAANFNEYRSRLSAQQRVSEVRSVMSEQFLGISDMLEETAVDFERMMRYDFRTAEIAAAALREHGITPTDAGCLIDRFGRMTLEVRVDIAERGRLNRTEIMQCLSAACERDFDAPCVTETRKGALLTLTERAAFEVEFGVCSLAAAKSGLCGDATDCFTDGKGRAVMILSDGMGTGGRAAVDGAMTSGLMSRLIRAGFGFDCSLRIVNSAMLFKSAEETMATLDIAVIDLFSGRVDLYKAGAAPTLIRRGGKTGKAECSSMPVGILRDVAFDTAGVNIGKGDIVLMMSDGVTSEGTDWICDELESFEGSAQQLADMIANCARRRRVDGHTDDITVVAAVVYDVV